MNVKRRPTTVMITPHVEILQDPSHVLVTQVIVVMAKRVKVRNVQSTPFFFLADHDFLNRAFDIFQTVMIAQHVTIHSDPSHVYTCNEGYTGNGKSVRAQNFYFMLICQN